MGKYITFISNKVLVGSKGTEKLFTKLLQFEYISRIQTSQLFNGRYDMKEYIFDCSDELFTVTEEFVMEESIARNCLDQMSPKERTKKFFREDSYDGVDLDKIVKEAIGIDVKANQGINCNGSIALDRQLNPDLYDIKKV